METSKILNALRMGVIPNVVLDELVVGRDSEIEELLLMFKDIKNEGTSTVKFIEGTYGSGKTFLLHLLKQRALKEGFVVASMSITSGFNLSKFDGLYSAMMGHLELETTLQNRGTSFEEIFEKWIKTIKKEKTTDEASYAIQSLVAKLSEYNTAFSMVLMTYIRARITNDEEIGNIASAWIKGDKNVSYELKRKLNVKGSVDIENAIDIFRGFVSLLNLMGYAGLIVFIDELELVMNHRSDTRMKAYANLRYIMDACGSGEFEKCGFVMAGTNELFTDAEKGFPSYDALNQRIGIVIGGNKAKASNLRQPIIELKPFSTADYMKMTLIALDLHKQHYGYETILDEASIYNLATIECTKANKEAPITIRNYSKKLIEILDLFQQNPELPIFKAKISGIKGQQL